MTQRAARGIAAPLLALALGAAGCRSLERFDTAGAPAYCGTIVGSEPFQDGFIPDNARPKLGLHLELDTSNLTTHPGTLSSDDAETGLCASKGGALFKDAKLRAIDELFHDPLSQLEFGDGHQHDFFAWVDSTCQGTMLAVVSMLTDGTVEVRLLKPAPEPPPDATADQRPGFAVFSLSRFEKGCSF